MGKKQESVQCLETYGGEDNNGEFSGKYKI